jgi:hypothetical protein
VILPLLLMTMNPTLPIPISGPAKVVPIFLRTEYQVNPLGVDQPKPLLSWQLRAVEPAARNLYQIGYEAAGAGEGRFVGFGGGAVWIASWYSLYRQGSEIRATGLLEDSVMEPGGG